MDRKQAEELMKAYLALSAPFNLAESLAREIKDRDERSKTLRALGMLMGRLYTDLMLPIIYQFPDLDPDRERYSNND